MKLSPIVGLLFVIAVTTHHGVCLRRNSESLKRNRLKGTPTNNPPIERESLLTEYIGDLSEILSHEDERMNSEDLKIIRNLIVYNWMYYLEHPSSSVPKEVTDDMRKAIYDTPGDGDNKIEIPSDIEDLLGRREEPEDENKVGKDSIEIATQMKDFLLARGEKEVTQALIRYYYHKPGQKGLHARIRAEFIEFLNAVVYNEKTKNPKDLKDYLERSLEDPILWVHDANLVLCLQSMKLLFYSNIKGPLSLMTVEIDGINMGIDQVQENELGDMTLDNWSQARLAEKVLKEMKKTSNKIESTLKEVTSAPATTVGQEHEKTATEDYEKEKTGSEDDEQEKAGSEDDEQEKTETEDDGPVKTTTEDDEQDKTARADDEQEKTNPEEDVREITITGDDEQEETATEDDKQEKTATEDDEPVKAATQVDEPVKEAKKVDEPVKVATQVDEQEETATEDDKQEKTATEDDEPVKAATKDDEPVKEATKVDEPVKAATQVDVAAWRRNKGSKWTWIYWSFGVVLFLCVSVLCFRS